MKKIMKIFAVMVLTFISFLMLGSCMEGEEESLIETKSGTEELIVLSGLKFDSTQLSQDDVDNLLYMKEEEKLARDVYLTLKEKYNYRIFSNIYLAEQRHIDAVIYLIDLYEISANEVLEVGTFENADFKDLYEKFVDSGSGSFSEACKVGALIEELDIKDLTVLLENTKNENLIRVFTNLKRASENHLRAFIRQLNRLNVDYTPTYLSSEEVKFILE